MFKRTFTTALTMGVAIVGLSLVATTAFAAFGGCVDSPENPTWILAGIGAVAAGVPWLRSTLKHRRSGLRDDAE